MDAQTWATAKSPLADAAAVPIGERTRFLEGIAMIPRCARP